MKAAVVAIQRPYELPRFRCHGSPLLTLYYIPSFEDCYGWTLYKTYDRPNYKLLTVVWKQVTDGQRIDELTFGHVASVSPEPTLEEIVSYLDEQLFAPKLAALATIRIPLFTKQPKGFDGESFDIHVKGEFDIEWWCQGPPEWAELVKWTHECIGIFREAMSS